jgi:hypothetical protein
MGPISINGTAGSNGTIGSSFNEGILLSNQAVLESTGVGPSAGSIQLTGIAATGDSGNRGITILARASLISVDGSIQLHGTGSTALGGDNNDGIYLDGAVVKSTGVGVTAASITLEGFGGQGRDLNRGIALTAATEVSSIDGNISVTGTGGATGGNDSLRNYGVEINGGTTINSASAAASSGTIAITGIGGSGDDLNDGVRITNTGTAISAVSGEIRVTGTGGSNGSVDSSLNMGVRLFDNASITSNGVGPAAASIHVQGTGGPGYSSNDGVGIGASGTVNARIQAVDGGITISGTGGVNPNGVSSLQNIGVSVTTQSTIASGGPVEITGMARSDGSAVSNSNLGVNLVDSTVQSTSVGANAAPVKVTGTGGAGGSINEGVRIQRSNVNAVDAAIQITGTGGSNASDTSSLNSGVRLTGGTMVMTTRGPIEFIGTGGNGEQANYGVTIDDIASKVTSVEGNISIQGTAGSNGTTGSNSNEGIMLASPTSVMSTGMGVSAASITLTGIGGAGDDGNRGIRLLPGAGVSSIDGDIRLHGTGRTALG